MSESSAEVSASSETQPSTPQTEQIPMEVEPQPAEVVVKAPFPALLGIDFGSTKLVAAVARSDCNLTPSIVRNDTADLYTNNIVAFKGEERLLGEAAVGHSNIHPQNAVEKVNRFLGQVEEGLDEHIKNTTNLRKGPNGELLFEVPYNSEQKQFRPEQIAAMLLRRIQKYSDNLSQAQNEPLVRDCVFVVPCSFDALQLQALKDAAHLAGFTARGFYRGPAALATVYGLKHPIVNEEETKYVGFVEMGATEFTLSFSKMSANKAEVREVLSTRQGGIDFDRALFSFVKDHVAKKFPDLDISSQRIIRRIYAAVNKAKTVLSTILQTEIVFPLADQDVRIPITREQFQEIAKEEIAAISAVILNFKEKLTQLGIKLDALEVLGGGSRMTFVKELLQKTFEIPLSFTLDSDLDMAVGVAALGASNTEGFQLKFKNEDTIPGIGSTVDHHLSEDQLNQLLQDEEKMQERDLAIVLKFRARNTLETFCFEMKNTLSDDKMKDSLPDLQKRRDFEDKLDETLAWLEINSDLGKEELENKQKELDQLGKSTLPEFFKKLDDLAQEKAANEAKAAAAALEDAKNASSEKRPKTNQQKLDVAKEKKELGNKHFVDLDYPSAVKLYTQALELVISMYDETPEQKKEGEAVKLACYLNIAQCLIKVKAYDKAIENCKSALAIDPDNAKALFRRGNAYFFTKEFELARVDLAKAAKITPDDKTVKSLLQKTETQIAQQKEREKQMCARMFG